MHWTNVDAPQSLQERAMSRIKLKGRKDGPPFARFPHYCHEHENYKRLSFPAKALLHELLYQYRGENNGDLCCAWGIVGPRWNGARNTLDRAEAELIERGWIVRTREGGRNRPHLYAVTIHAVNDCRGKLDAGWKAALPLGYWKLGHDPVKNPLKQAA